MMLRGEIARQAGCSPETVRYYESIGLLDEPARNRAGYRVYGRQHLDQLGLIRTAREFGFGLETIRLLIDMQRQRTAPCHEADELVAHQLARVDAKIQRLQALRDALNNMLEACPHDVVADCAVFRSLSAHGVAAD